MFVLPVSLYLFMHGTIQTATLVMCVLLAYASYKPLIKAMVHMDTMANLGVLLGEIKLPHDFKREVPHTKKKGAGGNALFTTQSCSDASRPLTCVEHAGHMRLI